MKIVKCDVLVIGSGGAGLRAAIEAHESGANVVVVGKCRRGDAHTTLATGGINAALGTMDRKDSWMVHAADTLKEGWMIADYRNVGTLCKNAPRAIDDLVRWGVKFHREKDGRLTQRFFGAHTYKRTCFVGDETGKAILKALVREAKRLGFPFYGEIYIASLLTSAGRVNGAIGIDMHSGDVTLFNSKATVLATGGHSRLYSVSSSRNFENTGDGIALSYEIGAELQDMEMIQFHPTGMVWPKKMIGTLVTEAVRGEGGHLYNITHERFMKRYDEKRMELGPRDEVARAIYSEIESGRGAKHRGVWLDITHRPKSYIKKRLPKMYRQFKAVGVDITKQRMEVAPTAHYSMGGVRVDFSTGQTTIPGLFAAGEITGGLHGANRLGGNSLAETIVFGRIVGRQAAKKSGKLVPANYTGMKASMKQIHEKGDANPDKIKKRLQEIMWDKVGIIKNTKDLGSALRDIERMKKSRFSKKDIFAALDAKALLVSAEAVVRASLIRKESRGAFATKDYPKAKKKLYNIICVKTAKGMRMYKKTVPEIKGTLKLLAQKDARVYGFVE